MKWAVLRIILTVLGVGLFILSLLLEIDGIAGFLLFTLSLFFVFIGITLKGFIKLLANML